MNETVYVDMSPRLRWLETSFRAVVDVDGDVHVLFAVHFCCVVSPVTGGSLPHTRIVQLCHLHLFLVLLQVNLELSQKCDVSSLKVRFCSSFNPVM